MLSQLDPQQRRSALLAALLLAVLGYGAYTYLYAPKAARVAEMQARLEVLETKNRAARRMVDGQGREGAEQRLALYRQQLEAVEGLIPSSEELPDLLDAISAEAQRTGVELALIQPVGATAEEFYTRRTYDLAVTGTYHQIGEFLTEIGSLPRIVTPSSLNLTVRAAEEPGAAPRLEARFSIETYVLPNLPPVADTGHAD